jgi:1-acyl-sn-glycerol-3-phosphate acyltransferase
MQTPFDLRDMRRFEVVEDARFVQGARLVADLVFRLPRPTRFDIQGLEQVPRGPVLFAMNHTHKYDFAALRYPMLVQQGRTVGTLIKTRSWNDAGMRGFLTKTANIPLTSKGYLLAADFQATLGRRPSEEDYRALRRHLEDGQPLPQGRDWDALQQTPREILGHPFDPSRARYIEVVGELYRAFMAESLRLCRQALGRGFSLQLYPQGSVSSRLTRGLPGAVQFARALGLPLYPVGCSGCREVFVGASPLARGGTIKLRFAPAFAPSLDDLPRDFVPFEPAHEAQHHAPLQRETDRLMQTLNGLLDPAYQGGPEVASDGSSGVGRFF